jgi:hemoglobin-like flavoprotein
LVYFSFWFIVSEIFLPALEILLFKVFNKNIYPPVVVICFKIRITSASMTTSLLDSKSNENIEKDPFLILFSSFETAEVVNTYLEHQYSAENFHFIIKVFEYQAQGKKSERKKMAKYICKTFIYPESPQQINIPASLSKQIQENMKTVPPDLFSAAKTHILNLMKKGFFPSFSRNISELVKKSWDRVLNKYSVDTVGITFYEKLFDSKPEVIPLFSGTDFAHSRKMFVMVINKCVSSLADLKQIILDIDDLAIKHCKYGVAKEHMKFAGEALTQTLKEFDESWDNEVEEAWYFVFSLIAALMKRWLPGADIKHEKSKCTLQ